MISDQQHASNAPPPGFLVHALASVASITRKRVFTACGMTMCDLAASAGYRCARAGSSDITCPQCLQRPSLPPLEQQVFVFGSNLAGRHGRGAALYARQHYGAIYGQGAGRQGMSYGIPTKDAQLGVLPLATIAGHVDDFLAHATAQSAEVFRLTRIGCGLAGYSQLRVAPLFRNAPANVLRPSGWDLCECKHLLLQHSVVEPQWPGVRFCSVKNCVCVGVEDA